VDSESPRDPVIDSGCIFGTVTRPGPPSIYESAATARLEVRITERQRSELQRAAEAQGTSVSSVIRELIDERVEDHRPFPGRRVTWDGDDEP
jgi:hypothetical protein